MWRGPARTAPWSAPGLRPRGTGRDGGERRVPTEAPWRYFPLRLRSCGVRPQSPARVLRFLWGPSVSMGTGQVHPLPWISTVLSVSPSLASFTLPEGHTHLHAKVARISDTGSKSGERTVQQPEGCTFFTSVYSLAIKSSLQPHGPCPAGAWRGGVRISST